MLTLQTSFKPFLFGGGGGVKSVSRDDCEEQEGKLLRLLPELRPVSASTVGIFYMNYLRWTMYHFGKQKAGQNY